MTFRLLKRPVKRLLICRTNMEWEAQAVKTVNKNMLLLEKRSVKIFLRQPFNHFSNISNLMLLHSELKLWNRMMESCTYFLCAKPDQDSGSAKVFFAAVILLIQPQRWISSFWSAGLPMWAQSQWHSCKVTALCLAVGAPQAIPRKMTTHFISNLIQFFNWNWNTKPSLTKKTKLFLVSWHSDHFILSLISHMWKN